MKIAINLIPFSSVQGIEIFAKNILLELLKLDKDEEFFILSSESLPDLLHFPQAKLIKIKGLKIKYTKALYQQLNIYPLLRKYKTDILFSPSPAAPFFLKNKVVVIHDCAYDRFPEFENLLSKIYFKAMFYGAKYFSKKIVTISDFSKKELIELYKIKPEKIVVIPEAVPKMPAIEDNFTRETKEKFNLKKSYFLYLGITRPRKNIVGLLEAFQAFNQRYPDYLLVLAGKIETRFLDVAREIEKFGLENKVIQTGFISNQEKVALYKGALALTFPSHYEGFGLPILESQSLGVPVLTSNTSSLPEVGGDSVLYVDPYNIKDITQGMEKLATDNNLRNDLIQKGFENIKRFSWERSARKLLDIFHSL